MTDDDANPREAYYAEARSWGEDRLAGAARSRRMAWTIAVAAGAVAALEALALVALAPLKTVVPYTLLVDRTTGFVQPVDPSAPLPVRAQAALTQSLLAQYVIARESFDVASVAAQYRKVALWSAGEARAQYLAQMPAGNPDSPLARCRAGRCWRHGWRAFRRSAPTPRWCAS